MAQAIACDVAHLHFLGKHSHLLQPFFPFSVDKCFQLCKPELLTNRKVIPIGVALPRPPSHCGAHASGFHGSFFIYRILLTIGLLDHAAVREEPTCQQQTEEVGLVHEGVLLGSDPDGVDIHCQHHGCQ